MRFERLEHTVVNEHGHLLVWQGSDSNLKPLLLMAHSDVVPATTTTNDQWTYPPFAGRYDGKYIWGRGSEDDKSNLIAILSIFTLLLERGFKPARTVIFALGFDEEGGAEQSYGARCLAQIVMQRYGEGGIELIVSCSLPCNKNTLTNDGKVRRRNGRHRDDVWQRNCISRYLREGLPGRHRDDRYSRRPDPSTTRPHRK